MELQKNVLEYLQKLDLNEKEIRVYLSLLESGPVGLAELAQQTDLKRSTTYSYIESLIRLGLVVKKRVGRKWLFGADNPSKIGMLVEEKEKKVALLKSGLPEIIRGLTAHISEIDDEVVQGGIYHYKGKKAVKSIYQETLEVKELCSYVRLQDVFTHFPENHDLYEGAMKKGLVMKEIIEDISDDSTSKKKNSGLKKYTKNKNYFCKYVPKGTNLSHVDYMIYNNKVAMVTFGKEPQGVVIHNKELFDHSKQIFDLLWSLLKAR